MSTEQQKKVELAEQHRKEEALRKSDGPNKSVGGMEPIVPPAHPAPTPPDNSIKKPQPDPPSAEQSANKKLDEKARENEPKVAPIVPSMPSVPDPENPHKNFANPNNPGNPITPIKEQVRTPVVPVANITNPVDINRLTVEEDYDRNHGIGAFKRDHVKGDGTTPSGTVRHTATPSPSKK